MELQDLQSYAQDALTESLAYNLKGFQDVADVVSAVEGEEPEFDGDSYCPYYSQQVEVISRYESDFGDEAEDLSGEDTYKASDWQKAQTAYAYGIAFAGFAHYFEKAKQELTEGLEEFGSDAQSELEADEIKVQITNDCPHGWASHDRELEDGTMIWESGQLDGCNGMAREVCGLWVSCCIDQSKDEEETA